MLARIGLESYNAGVNTLDNAGTTEPVTPSSDPLIAAPETDRPSAPSGSFAERLRGWWRRLIAANGVTLYEIIETMVLAVVTWLVVDFVSARFIVEGNSMEPNQIG